MVSITNEGKGKGEEMWMLGWRHVPGVFPQRIQTVSFAKSFPNTHNTIVIFANCEWHNLPEELTHHMQALFTSITVIINPYEKHRNH